MIIASDLKYITDDEPETLYPQIDIVARQLNGLRAAIMKKPDSNHKQQTVNQNVNCH